MLLRCKENFTEFFQCEKSCQNERSSALCSLDINKLSRVFAIKPKLEFSEFSMKNLVKMKGVLRYVA